MQANDLDPNRPAVARYRRTAQTGEEEEPARRQAKPSQRVQVVLELTGRAGRSMTSQNASIPSAASVTRRERTSNSLAF